MGGMYYDDAIGASFGERHRKIQSWTSSAATRARGRRRDWAVCGISVEFLVGIGRRGQECEWICMSHNSCPVDAEFVVNETAESEFSPEL